MWIWLNILRPKRGFILHLASTWQGVVLWLVVSYCLYYIKGPTWLLWPASFSMLCAPALYQRYRLIVDTPTSKLSSGAQGYVELQGKAGLLEGEGFRGLPDLPVTLWLPGYFEDKPFVLEDAKGRCLVNPHWVEVIAAPADTHLWWLPAIYPGQAIYALGELRTYGGENMHVNKRQRLMEVLATWKSQPYLLLQQFDTNRNGQIDPEEWPAIRAAAEQWVDEDLREHKAKPGTHILDAPRIGQWCVITNIPPEKLAKRYYLMAHLHLLSWLLMVVWLA